MKKALILLIWSVLPLTCTHDPGLDDSDLKSLVTLKGSYEEYSDAREGDPQLKSDPFVLNELITKGDSVYISVSYSGGCRKHTFEIIWNETFSNTVPPSTGLIVIHDANGDMCEAWITETLAFSFEDLSGSVSFDTVCVNILNGTTPSDSVSSGGYDPADSTQYEPGDYKVVFPQGDSCQVEVTALRVICGAGLYDNLWFALNDSVNAGNDNFYFRKYLQPVALSDELKGFIPVQGKKYLIGATIQNEHSYGGVIICMAYSGPSVPVRITCVSEKE